MADLGNNAGFPALAYPEIMAATRGVTLNIDFNMAISLLIIDDDPEITGSAQGTQSTRYPLDISGNEECRDQ